MTTQQIAIVLMCIALIAVTWIAIWAIGRARYWRRLCEERRLVGEEWERVATERSATAHNYMNAAKLISIHQHDGMVVWTFARGDKFHTYETYASMSDDVAQWRRDLGLED